MVPAAVLLLSAVLQVWLMASSLESAGPRAVVVDSERYFDLARRLQTWTWGESPLTGDLVRTPGFPLLIVGAASLSQTDISTIVAPARNWAATNIAARSLIRSVFSIHAVLGLFVPLLLYFAVRLSTNSIGLAAVAALVAPLDLATLSFQFKISTEALSFFLQFASWFALALYLRTKRLAHAILAALFCGASILTRPPMVVLGVIALAVVSADAWFERGGKSAGKVAAIFLACLLSGPIAWSTVNWITFGKFFYTKNFAWSAQNFSIRYFARMEVDNDRLLVLRARARELALRPGNRLYRDRTYFGFTRDGGLARLREELEVDSELEVLEWIERACSLTIRAHPKLFLRGGLERFAAIWTEPYTGIAGLHSTQRLGEIELFPRAITTPHGFLLLGSRTWLVLALSTAIAFPMLRRREQRLLLGAAVSFLLAFTFLSCLVDETEAHRHCVQSRVLANALATVCVLYVAGRVGKWLLPIIDGRRIA